MFEVIIKDSLGNQINYGKFYDEIEANEWIDLLKKKNADLLFDKNDLRPAMEAEKAKDQAKAQAKKDRMQALKTIAWPTIDTVAELKAIVKTLVEETLKDE